MFVVPLTLSAHRYARTRSTTHAGDRSRSRQTYLNALAARAVAYQLQCWGVELQPEVDNCLEGEFFETAGVTLANGERWDCRPLLPGERACGVPPAVRQGHAGYFLVELAADLRSATILGFSRQPAAALQRDNLHALADWPAVSAPVTRLSDWLEGKVAGCWQSLERLLGAREDLAWAAATRGLEPTAIRQAKLLDLDMVLGDRQAVLLVASIRDGADGRASARVRLLPGEGDRFLPENLRLQMLDEVGTLLQDVRARDCENFIQLRRFCGHSGDRFSICIGLGRVTVAEEFAF